MLVQPSDDIVAKSVNPAQYRTRVGQHESTSRVTWQADSTLLTLQDGNRTVQSYTNE